MSEIFDELVTIKANEPVAHGHCRVRFHAPKIAAKAQPGQFVNVKCGGKTLLRRPFSFSRASGASFEIIVRVIGEGTLWLSEAEPGHQLRALGPLGNGFRIDGEVRSAILVGGGCGIGPMEMLGEALRKEGIETIALLGCESKEMVPLEAADLERLGIETHLAVMTGNGGHVGPVTDLLENVLADAAHVEGRTVFACGPWPMLKKVAELTNANELPCQVLLEEMMGCGMGACMSCAVQVFQPDGGVMNKKVCTDGPMFWAHEVDWDAKD